ncbi:MAG: hypothetical protein IT384_33840 [Deltaproteobacteria bacterium]|nr:hypothetical protein [Deltaproteobacteria bacterium]
MHRRFSYVCLSLAAVAVLAASGCSENRRPPGSTGVGNKDAQTAGGEDGGTDSGLGCACNQNAAICDPGCVCDPACTACACNTSLGCDPSCACDPECQPGYDAGFFDAAPSSDTGFPPQDSGFPNQDAAGFPDAVTPFDGGVLTGDPFNASTLAQQYAQAICAYQTRCEPAVYAFLGTTEPQCVTNTSARIVATWNAFSQIINAGRAAFRQSAFNACLQAYQSADCITGVAPAACDGLFIGNRPSGVACGLSIECGPNLWCALSALGSCGTCQPVGQSGQDCSQTVCATGLDCLQVDQAGSVACVPINAQENQACNTLQTGLCQGHLQCVGPAAGPFTCRRPATGTATCDANAETAPACNIYQNEACNTATQRCGAVTWLAPGGTCADTALCNSQGHCEPDMGNPNCTAYLTVGATCDQANDLCAAETAYCFGTTCAALGASGQSCQSSAQCQDTLYCVGGSCGNLTWPVCN